MTVSGTTYAQLARDAQVGDRLLVDDGKVGLVVTGIEGNDVVCMVTEGGPVSNHKGLSMPGMNVSVPALSEKDIDDLEFALGLGVDLVALSFVRSPSDVELVHEVMDRVGRRVPVIAKLEAGGDREPRGRRPGFRRDHGRPRRPGVEIAAGGGSARAEAGDPDGPREPPGR